MVRDVYTLVQLVHFSPVAVHQLYHQHSQIWDVMKQHVGIQYFTHYKKPLLDAIASPSTYPCQSVGEWVIDSFRFGDSYLISELCELVYRHLSY